MKYFTLHAMSVGILPVFVAGALIFLPKPVRGQPVEAWAQRYNNPADSNDQAQQVVSDLNGNLMVIGYTDEGITGQDMLIIKFSQAGVALWTNRYDGPANGNDRAVAAAVDGSGNVYVTGVSKGSGTGTFDWETIAYSDAGVPLWTNRYNGPGNGDDEPRGVALDGNGDVFVMGYSTGSGGNPDYTTVKYSASGTALWTNRYNGTGNNSDFGNGLAVDKSGNVIVTGTSIGSGGDYDWATVAYSGTGVPLWTNLCNGSANSTDDAKAVAVDANGNVFVTGYTTENGTFADSTTIKYSGTGVPLWTNRYNGPLGFDDETLAAVVDTGGNVIVTGYSYGTNYYDYLTIKYSNAGVPLWTNIYNGPGNSDDRADAVVLDGSGNVFVTGFSYGSVNYDYATIKYSSAGLPLWTNRYDGPISGSDKAFSVAVDGSGNVCVTGFSPGSGGSYDFATIKYSGAGALLWANRYNGAANYDDQPQALVVDLNGNVIVTGFSYNSAGASDWSTLKYSGAGVPLWTNRFNGPGSGNAQANAVVADPNGNVYVAGYSTGSGGNPDYVTIAYSSGGMALWTNRYNGSANNSDFANAMAIDASGNVIVTGTSVGSGGNYDYATVAYSGAGVPLWTNRYNGPGNGTDDAEAVAVDGNGNAFVTGYSVGNGTSDDYATVAYSSTGVPLWTNRYDGITYQDDAADIVVDGNGNVIVTGSSLAFNSSTDFITIKYSNGGVPLWTNRYNGVVSSSDVAQAVAVDTQGNVFVTGYTVGNGSGFDYATIGYSSAGLALWTNIFNGPANANDLAYSVKVDKSGNVIVAGNSTGVGSGQDFTTIEYSGAGMALWTNRYNGPANSDDALPTRSCLGIGPDGSVFVTGASRAYANGTSHDYATVKYMTSATLPVRLDIQKLGSQAVLSWTGAGFALQSGSAVTGLFTNIPGAISPYTNPITGSQLYFRLKAN
jgi:uncharacterized delta-60 repeat protein